MRVMPLAAAMILLLSLGCHPGPVVDTGPRPPAVGGTIAGIVSTETNTAVTGRRVTAIESTTGTRYEATTGANGGYTIKVPEGNYRLELQLQAGERIVKAPDDVRIDKSDVDSHRDFVITGGL